MESFEEVSFKSLSLRDPAGKVLAGGERILRVVTPKFVEHVLRMLSLPKVIRWMAEGSLVRTKVISDVSDLVSNVSPGEHISPQDFVLEHEQIFFPSYPYEWCPEMLAAAGELTLNLAEELLPEQVGLKDASAFNVLFRGTRPVLVDFLSLESRDPQSCLWLPFGQFVRQFLIPLICHRQGGRAAQALLARHREGIDSAEAFYLLKPWKRFLPPYFSLVTVPHYLQKWFKNFQVPESFQNRKMEESRAQFILRRLFRSLGRTLAKIGSPDKKSLWGNYIADDLPYTGPQYDQKKAFVKECLTKYPAAAVLDVGCNEGTFSLLAARRGARVVAVDSDMGVVRQLFKKAHTQKLDVQPLCIDVVNPTPAMGWMNAESLSFMERTKDRFDMVFMLALVHHLAIGQQVPMIEIAKFAAHCTKKFVIVESIGVDDLMVQRLQKSHPGGRKNSDEDFEKAFFTYFEPIKSEWIRDSSRKLYLMRKKTS